MSRKLPIYAGVGLVLALGVSAGAQDAAMVAKGKEIYDAATPKCKVCHAIGGVGNAKGALDSVGADPGEVGAGPAEVARVSVESQWPESLDDDGSRGQFSLR